LKRRPKPIFDAGSTNAGLKITRFSTDTSPGKEGEGGGVKRKARMHQGNPNTWISERWWNRPSKKDGATVMQTYYIFAVLFLTV
jgi:hypothetical protein